MSRLRPDKINEAATRPEGKWSRVGNLERKCRIPASGPQVAFVIEPRVARFRVPRPGMQIKVLISVQLHAE